MDSVGHRHGFAIEVDGDICALRNSNAIARCEVVADDVDFVASTDRSIDVVLDIVVIDISADGCLRVGKIGAFQNYALFRAVVWALVDEWEEVDNFVIEGFAVERRIIISTFKGNFAFDETVIEIEGTILL